MRTLQEIIASKLLIEGKSTSRQAQTRMRELKGKLTKLLMAPGAIDYEAIDDVREEIKSMEKLSRVIKKDITVKEAAGEQPQQAYNRLSIQAMMLLKQIKEQLILHDRQHQQNPEGWGHPGDLGKVVAELNEVLTFLKTGEEVEEPH